ncbi:hypothetical protein D3C81_1854580 [compost metagenome]
MNFDDQIAFFLTRGPAGVTDCIFVTQIGIQPQLRIIGDLKWQKQEIAPSAQNAILGNLTD